MDEFKRYTRVVLFMACLCAALGMAMAMVSLIDSIISHGAPEVMSALGRIISAVGLGIICYVSLWLIERNSNG